MISGTGTTSIRKQDLTTQKNIATGFVKTSFAHQCTGGETGINLASLTLPSQMSANGFTNPTGAQLAAANLLQYRKNLKLMSSLRGNLVDYLSYTVSSGTQITFQGFTAQPGEIFQGTIDYSAVNGIQVVSATGQPATGVLAAGTTDFNIGFPVPTNQYSTTQLGGVLVHLDGVLQTRNTGNSSTNLDGNYYEVDNGSGNFSVVRFNVSDPVNARNVLVVPNGLLVPQPDGSLLTTVQAQAGQINQLASYVASLAGLSTTSVLGGAASYTDLLAFGNLVNTINNTYANLTKNNTWTAAQALVGITDGSAAGTGKVGELFESSDFSLTGAVGSTGVNKDIFNFTLQPGDWDISFSAMLVSSATTGWNRSYALLGTVSGDNQTGANFSKELILNNVVSTTPTDIPLTSPVFVKNITSPTTYYFKLRADYTGGGAPAYTYYLRARRVR